MPSKDLYHPLHLCRSIWWRNFQSLAIQRAASEEAGQTVWMCRLIWLFTEHICHHVHFLMFKLIYILVGKSCTHAVVLARLVVSGEDHGMHPFMVQLRSLDDHTPMPGKYMYHIYVCSRRRNRPVKKIFLSSAPTGDRTRYPWISNRAS